MDERALIDCVEKMRAHVVGEVPVCAAELARLRDADWRALDAQAIADKAVAASAKIDDLTADGRRRVRAEAERLEAKIAEAATVEYARDQGDAPAHPPVTSTATPSGSSAQSTPPSPSTPPARVIDIGAAPRLAALGAQFRGLVDLEPPAQDAAEIARRVFPGLGGNKAFHFLAGIGYPAAVPAKPALCFLNRLLVLAGKPESAEQLADYQCRIAEMARLAGTTVPELDALVAAWSGARRPDRFEPVCVERPRCGRCALRAHCIHYAAHGAPEPEASNPVRAWREDDRPREKLACGHRLSDAELLAIILRTGTRRVSAVDLGRRIMGRFGSLPKLAAASEAELRTVPGIGPAKAAEIRAAVEMGRRLSGADADGRDAQPQVQTSEDVFRRFRARFMGATQEVFLLLTLNAKNRITREIEVSKGTLNASIVHPRDVFNHALREAAHAVIFVHNHPSGDPSPSAEDRTLTRRLAEAGKLLGISVLDHVIVGSRSHYSFADQGELR